MTELACHAKDEFVPLKTIARQQNISEKYLESIIGVLSKAGIIDGLRGKGGGYRPESRCVGILGRRDTSAYGGVSLRCRVSTASRTNANARQNAARCRCGEARHDNQRLSRPCIDCRSPSIRPRSAIFKSEKLHFIIYTPAAHRSTERSFRSEAVSENEDNRNNKRRCAEPVV